MCRVHDRLVAPAGQGTPASRKQPGQAASGSASARIARVATLSDISSCASRCSSSSRPRGGGRKSAARTARSFGAGMVNRPTALAKDGRIAHDRMVRLPPYLYRGDCWTPGVALRHPHWLVGRWAGSLSGVPARDEWLCESDRRSSIVDHCAAPGSVALVGLMPFYLVYAIRSSIMVLVGGMMGLRAASLLRWVEAHEMLE